MKFNFSLPHLFVVLILTINPANSFKTIRNPIISQKPEINYIINPSTTINTKQSLTILKSSVPLQFPIVNATRDKSSDKENATSRIMDAFNYYNIPTSWSTLRTQIFNMKKLLSKPRAAVLVCIINSFY